MYTDIQDHGLKAIDVKPIDDGGLMAFRAPKSKESTGITSLDEFDQSFDCLEAQERLKILFPHRRSIATICRDRGGCW
jgi:hypothetical protein